MEDIDPFIYLLRIGELLFNFRIFNKIINLGILFCLNVIISLDMFANSEC